MVDNNTPRRENNRRHEIRRALILHVELIAFFPIVCAKACKANFGV